MMWPDGARIAATLAVALISRSYATSQGPICAQRPSDFDDLPPILRKALHAPHHLSYIGTRTVQWRRDGVPTIHVETITHRGNQIRIDFPEGSPEAGQVIVENETERRHYFPVENEIRILAPRHEETLERLQRILRNRDKYVLTTGSGVTVANFRTEQVTVSDHQGNAVERLYVEPQSGLIVKRQLIDKVGTVVGGFEFNQIQFNPHLDPSVFTLRRNGARIVTPIELLERLAKKEGFSVVTLPETSGFKLAGSNSRKIEGQDVLMQTYLGHDGRHLSLFELKANVSADRLREFAARQDFRFAYWHAQGNTFVLMGSLSDSDLVQMAGPISGGTATSGL